MKIKTYSKELLLEFRIFLKALIKFLRNSFYKLNDFGKERYPNIKKFVKKHQTKILLIALSIPVLTIWILVAYKFITTPRAPKINIAKETSPYYFEAKSAIFSVEIGDKKTNEPKVEFALSKSRDKSVTFYPASARTGLTAPREEKNQIVFSDVYQDIDFRYQTIPLGIKEDIVIKKPTDISTYPFYIETKGVTPQYFAENLAGGVFYDKDKNYLFHFEKPYAIDAKGVRTEKVGITIRRDDKNGKLVALLTIDKEWLKNPNRTFPVVIDPTVVHDTTAEFATGQFNRITDTGSGSSPVLETYYQELADDQYAIGLWHMNEGTDNTCAGGQDACDSSGNGNHGTFNGNAAFISTSRLGSYATTYDGTGDYTSAGDIDAIDNATTLSSCAWVNNGSTTTDGAIVSKTNVTTDGFILFRDDVGSSGRTDMYTIFIADSADTDSARVESASNTASSGLWDHVCFTYQASSGTGLHLYVNGQEDINSPASTSSIASINSTTNAFTIGARADAGFPYTGKIDEVIVSNRIFTPEEIKLMAQRRPYGIHTSDVINLGSNVTIWNSLSWTELGVATGDGETLKDTTSLIAQWNFNEISGTTANNDAEGSSCGGTPADCDGTLTGFASTGSQDAAVMSGWTADNKRWGAGALMFDGTDDIVSCTDATCGGTSKLDSGGAAWSYGTWFKSDDAQGRLISKWGSTTAEQGYLLSYGDATAGKVRAAIYTSSIVIADSPEAVNDGGWHYAVATYDGANLKLYVDGQLMTTTATTGNIQDGTGNFNLAGETGTANYRGMLDHTFVIRRTLSAAEVLSNYNSSNLEFQTRVGADTSPDDGSWEAWRPTTNETSIVSYDNLTSSINWSIDSEANPGGDILKFTSTNTTEANSYTYWQTLDNATTLATGDTVEYDVYVLNNVNGLGGIDIKFTDATYARDAASGWVDQNGVNCHPLSNLVSSGYVYRRWFHRECTVPSGLNGKIVDFFDVVNEVDTATAVTVYYDNFVIKNSSGTVKAVVYNNGSPTYNALDFESNAANTGNVASTGNFASNPFSRSDDSTIKVEGTGSMRMEIGKPKVEGNTAGLWHMEETGGTGAYIKDATTNANNGTPTGTTVGQGIAGKARSFNGSSDYISVPAASGSLNINANPVTIEAWVKPMNVNGTLQGIVDRGTSGVNGYGFTLSSTNKFNLGGQGGGNFDGATTVVQGQWYHVAAVTNAASSVLYVNGVSDGTGTVNVVSSTGNLYIGSKFDGTNPTSFFNGIIDEVKISNVARTAEEIAETYRAGRDHYLDLTGSTVDLSAKQSLPFYVAADRPGTYLEAIIGESAFANYQPDTNTVGLWHLAEESGSGAYVKDSSGNSHNGTPTTGTKLAQGKIGKARNFNGTSGYVDIANSTTFDVSTLSIDAWVYSTDFAQNGFIFEKGPVNTQYSCFFETASGVAFRTLNAAATIDTLYVTLANSGVANNQWNHLACVYNGSQKLIYVNGRLIGSKAYTETLRTGQSGERIGAYGGATPAYFFNGIIDEVRVSNTARSADEIRQSYEAGLRTHPVTIDFGAKLDSGNLITGSGDLGFTVDATYYGLNAKGSNLYKGDKIIVRENYDGTEYIAQGTVTAVTASTGAVTVTSWDSGSTFPSGGFTANASVFKWQREYWNITEPLNSQLNAVTKLTLRLTNGDEGRTVWIDDLKSASDYLTNPSGSTITSSIGNQYFQYRVIEHSADEAVSASLTAVTLDYVVNTAPNTPSLDAPINTATNQSLTPLLKTTATDNDSDYIRYKIELCTDVGMTTNCQTFDQTSSQTGWSGQNAQSGTAYASGTQGVYTVQTPLIASTTYYWRSYAIDPGGTNTFSSTQGTPFSFTTTTAPSAPTDPLTEGATNPTNVTDTTPEFSAIHNDTNGDSANYYEIEVNTASDFTGTVMWDSGQTSMTTTANGVRSPDISYAGTALTFNGATFYWRIRFTDTNGAVGAWSATQNFTMNNLPGAPTLDSPANGATDIPLAPSLKTTGTDANGDYLRYKIELCTNDGMTANCQTFDQTISQTGWSGQNAQSGTAYASGTQATFTLQSNLQYGTTYYWRSYAIDPGGSNTFGATQSPPYSFTTVNTFTLPRQLLTESQQNPAGVTDTTPEFSALCPAVDGNANNLTKYRIQVSTENTHASPIWDSGALGTAMTACSVGARSSDISFGGTPLALDGTIYYWRIKFFDSSNTEGEWSTENALFSMTSTQAIEAPTNCRLSVAADDSSITIRWNDNSSSETNFRIERNVNAGGFLLLNSPVAGSTSYIDTGVSSGNTYQYRVRAEGSTNSSWCTTSTLNLSLGTFQFGGLNLKGLNIR